MQQGVYFRCDNRSYHTLYYHHGNCFYLFLEITNKLLCERCSLSALDPKRVSVINTAEICRTLKGPISSFQLRFRTKLDFVEYLIKKGFVPTDLEIDSSEIQFKKIERTEAEIINLKIVIGKIDFEIHKIISKIQSDKKYGADFSIPNYISDDPAKVEEITSCLRRIIELNLDDPLHNALDCIFLFEIRLLIEKGETEESLKGLRLLKNTYIGEEICGVLLLTQGLGLNTTEDRFLFNIAKSLKTNKLSVQNVFKKALLSDPTLSSCSSSTLDTSSHASNPRIGKRNCLLMALGNLYLAKSNSSCNIQIPYGIQFETSFFSLWTSLAFSKTEKKALFFLLKLYAVSDRWFGNGEERERILIVVENIVKNLELFSMSECGEIKRNLDELVRINVNDEFNSRIDVFRRSFLSEMSRLFNVLFRLDDFLIQRRGRSRSIEETRKIEANIIKRAPTGSSQSPTGSPTGSPPPQFGRFTSFSEASSSGGSAISPRFEGRSDVSLSFRERSLGSSPPRFERLSSFSEASSSGSSAISPRFEDRSDASQFSRERLSSPRFGGLTSFSEASSSGSSAISPMFKGRSDAPQSSHERFRAFSPPAGKLLGWTTLPESPSSRTSQPSLFTSSQSSISAPIAADQRTQRSESVSSSSTVEPESEYLGLLNRFYKMTRSANQRTQRSESVSSSSTVETDSDY